MFTPTFDISAGSDGASGGDMNQMGTSCNLQWPNWPNTCRHVKCDYIGLKSANHLKVSFSEILLDIN